MDFSLLGINAAVRGMAAAQTALNTMGHNVANANTEGYSRQRVNVSAASPLPTPGFNTPVRVASIGAGTQINGINRLRDEFLDLQVRRENATLGANQAFAEHVKLIEDIFHEPSETGLSALFNEFFNSWHTLTSNPESPGVRAVVRDQAATLANALNDASQRLTTQRKEIDGQLRNAITDINLFTTQIAQLNVQIAEVQVGGGSANQLLDQRDLLLEKISKLVNLHTVQHEDGNVWVYLNGRALVAGSIQTPLEFRPNAEGGYSDIVFEGSVVPQPEVGAALGALLQLRDDVIGRERYRPAVPALPDTPNGILHRLDTLANMLANEVNALHRAGSLTDGTPSNRDFFVNFRNPGSSTMGAGQIAVNPDIMNGTAGLELIATGGTPSTGPGDTAIAKAIAALRNKSTMGPTATFEDDYRNFLAGLGVLGLSAQRMVKNQGEVLNHLSQRKEEVSGVNMDEEMADMVRYQHAYQASARALNTFDEILDRIINGLGAGR
ncbi:Flagellar hook-associated protein 1 [compost metagenome]